MSVKRENDATIDSIPRVGKDRVKAGVGKLWVGSIKRPPLHPDEQGAACVVELARNMEGKHERLLLYDEPHSTNYRITRKGPA
jgi:hypothetical protein